MIWWSIAYQHGDLYKIEELGEVSVDLDKMNNMNLNFLTENIGNLNTANVLSKSKRSIVGGFEDQDKILNKLAYSILNNRTTIQQLIEHFNLSKLKLNSTSGTNIYHKMEDGTNLTHFLSYAKNNEKLKETFASHNISLNKIAKLVQPKRLQQQLNDSQRPAEQNDIKLLNSGDQFAQSANLEAAQQQQDQSIIMNTVTTEEHLPQLPIANLTVDQRHQLENLFYLMQLQYLLQQERNKQQIAKFLAKLAKKAHNINLMNKPSHPPETPPAHPLPSTAVIEEEQQNEREQEAKHKEQERKAEQARQQLLEKLEKQKQAQQLINETNQTGGGGQPVDSPADNSLPNLPNLSDLPSSDAVIEEAVEKASEIVIPGCGLNGTKACRRVCLDNINSFADALLFSIETQHTIGYGSRHPRGDCKIVLLVLMVQSIFGCLIQCFVVGFVFAKLSRPQNRHQTLVFSKRAVINLGEYDQTYDFVGDAHNNDNQFNLNFEELQDLVCLMKSGEMQEMIQDCGCTGSETGSSDQNRRHSSDAISTDDLLAPSSLQGSCLNSFNHLKEHNLLNNFLNIPSSKRCSNVSFLNSGLSTLQSKVSNLNHLNLRCETEHNVDYTGNKNYRLEFRLGDIRERSHIINARISAYFLSKENYYFKNELLPKSGKFAKYQLFKKRRSEVDYSNLRLNSETPKTYNYNELVMEKKLHNFTQKKLALKIDNVEHSDGELPLVLWPIVVSHEINDRSPLYNIAKEEITNSKFEIVIVLEGTTCFF